MQEQLDMSQVTRAEVLGTGQTADEIRREEFKLEDMPITKLTKEGVAYSPTEELKKLEAEMTPTPVLSEEQNALLVFQSHINLFIQKLNTYSGAKSQIIRAWTNAAISPLNNDKLHFSYPEEKELFDLFTELNAAKFILMMHGMVRDGKIEIKKPLLEQSSETPSTEELNKMMDNLGNE